MTKKDKSSTQLPITQQFYEVEQILNKRLTSNGMMYLIKWKNYPDPKDYTWEPIQHLTEVEDLVREFNNVFDKRAGNGRQNVVKAEPVRQIKSKKQEEVESELSEEEVKTKEREPKKRGRKKKLPSVDKSEKKHTTSDNDEEEEEEEESKPRRLQPKKGKEEPKETEEVDKYWEKDGFELGRIHKHYSDGKSLIFNVNVNKGELVVGSVYLPFEDLKKISEEKLTDYMENWVRNFLIEKAENATPEFQQTEEYWKSIE